MVIHLSTKYRGTLDNDFNTLYTNEYRLLRIVGVLCRTIIRNLLNDGNLQHHYSIP